MSLELNRQRFTSKVCEALVSAWLSQHAKSVEKDWQRDLVIATVNRFLQHDRREELTEYLVNVAEGGLELAQKEAKKRNSAGWRYGTGVALVNLIRLVLVYAIFAAATSKFETICFALLVLIYPTFPF